MKSLNLARQFLSEPEEMFPRPVVKLKRTFNQSNFHGGYIKFWRVTAPSSHPRYQSDLSVEGLREAGII